MYTAVDIFGSVVNLPDTYGAVVIVENFDPETLEQAVTILSEQVAKVLTLLKMPKTTRIYYFYIAHDDKKFVGWCTCRPTSDVTIISQ